MFRTIPAPNDWNTGEIADLIEAECLHAADGNVSALDIERILDRADDHTSSTDEQTKRVVVEAFHELSTRSENCGMNGLRYPFKVSNRGNFVEVMSRTHWDPKVHTLYVFLLLATRLNMKTERTQAQIDGAALFERLCGEVAERFWGGPEKNTRHFIFGTGRQYEGKPEYSHVNQSAFGRKIAELCEKLGEGYGFRPRPGTKVTAVDGKLDIVVWKKFADARSGQLIGFGQCKTGTHWQNDLSKLNPQQFCSDWMRKSPPVLPHRLYFVSDRIVTNWENHCSAGGLIFDRCRIMEYADRLSAPILRDVKKWVRAAAKTKGLKIS